MCIDDDHDDDDDDDDNDDDDDRDNDYPPILVWRVRPPGNHLPPTANYRRLNAPGSSYHYERAYELVCQYEQVFFGGGGERSSLALKAGHGCFTDAHGRQSWT